MYIKYNGVDYSCLCNPNEDEIIYFGLPEDFPTELTGVIVLCADDGFELRSDVVGDYSYRHFENGVLTLSNRLESVVQVDLEPTAQDDTDAMMIDHEYRLTLLELGLTE